jgi:alkylation response protein AidB-like acyl-CoA dehydrogenase
MDFAFSEEQELLRESARDYLGDRYPVDRVIELANSDAGWDPKAWDELARLGWLDRDLGLLEHAVIAEETGRALFPGPLWSTLGLARPAGYDGDLPATLAYAEPDGPSSLRDLSSVSTKVDGDRITGHKVVVSDGTCVGEFAVVARDGDGLAVYAVAGDAEGLTVVPRSTMDRTRRFSELIMGGAPARRLGGGDVLDTARRRALALLACEAVGIAQRALDTAAEHAKTREAFSRPIGTFQAISHQIADVYTATQLARSLAYWAAWAVDADDERADLAVAAAKSSAAEAAVLASEHAIQVLGGVGFTWEHFLHRFYKRAQWIDAFEGYGGVHRAVIASAILDQPSNPVADAAAL